MKRAPLALAFLLFETCGPNEPAEHYGFIARLGRDTVSLESVTRRGNTVTSDEVDRFPRVRQRHTVMTLGPGDAIQRLVMDIRTPSELAEERERHVVAEVTRDSVHISKRDKTGEKTSAFATGGTIAVAHLPQMYSLYERYFDAALQRAAAAKKTVGDTVLLRQFYIDREFDRFPLHMAVVRLLSNNKAEIEHDWLSGVGEATLDSSRHLLHYSGARTTYRVEVDRLTAPPDVQTIGAQFAALETKNGGVKQLSVRDTARASIGSATFSVDYGRPLARGRQLVGGIIPYDQVWRTGANAATQFPTTATITLAGLTLAPGTYTLWSIPHTNGVDLIVNKQYGQWGTSYLSSRDLGHAPMATEALTTPVEQFTISIVPTDAHHGSLAMEWGSFRWTAPIVVR
jgi:hypothetical protein